MNKSLIAGTSSSETSHTLPPALPPAAGSKRHDSQQHSNIHEFSFWLDEDKEGIVKFVVTQLCKEPEEKNM